MMKGDTNLYTPRSEACTLLFIPLFSILHASLFRPPTTLSNKALGHMSQGPRQVNWCDSFKYLGVHITKGNAFYLVLTPLIVLFTLRVTALHITTKIHSCKKAPRTGRPEYRRPPQTTADHSYLYCRPPQNEYLSQSNNRWRGQATLAIPRCLVNCELATLL
jgi:hypothetical protein